MGWFRRNEHDEEQLSAYLDGELDARHAENVERHLSTCAACSALLDELRETRAMLSALPAQTPRRSFVLGAEYARAPVQEAARPSRRFNLVLAPAAALTVFVALVAVDLGNFSSTSSDESGTMLTAATSRQATDDFDAAGAAGSALAPEDAQDARSSAEGADAKGEEQGAQPANSGGGIESVTGSTGATADGVQPPGVMSTEMQATPEMGEIAITAAGTAAEEPSPEPLAFEAPGATEDDGGISTLRLLQVLAIAAFLASGFYVFVWPRVTRGGS